MKKFLYSFMVISTLTILLTGCCTSHDWQEATCTQPMTCSKCGKTEGETLEHTWQEATCAQPKTCSVCGATEGTTLPHTWQDATCTQPKTCSVCGATEGNPIEHTPSEWVVDTPATCIAEGSQHSVCAVCGNTITQTIKKLDHKPGEWQITKAATAMEKGEKQQLCTFCGTVLGTDSYELSAVEKKNAYKNMCQSYTYKEIARNPDSYKGNYAALTGEIIQSMEDGDSYTLRVSITKGEYGFYTDPILVTYTKKDASESRLLEDDIVTLYGQLAGTYTYKTVLGNELTIPLLKAEYIDIH